MTAQCKRSVLLVAVVAALGASAAARGSTATGAHPLRLGRGPLGTSAARLIAGAPLPSISAHGAANVNPATYDDSTGDGGTAPDIKTVVVSNDPNNQITFRINTSSLATPSNVQFLAGLDTDQNAGTGNQGDDYGFIADLSAGRAAVLKWDGTQFSAVSAGTATVTTDSGGITFTINASDLGGTTGFNFWALSSDGGNTSAGHYDAAPDNGRWNYLLGPASQLTLKLQGFLAPKKVKAAKTLTTAMIAARSDTGATVGSDAQVQCQAAIGSKPLKLTFSGFVTASGVSAAICEWRVPRTAHRKTIRGTETITYQGASITQTFTTRVK
jgi:hypothetical protein